MAKKYLKNPMYLRNLYSRGMNPEYLRLDCLNILDGLTTKRRSKKLDNCKLAIVQAKSSDEIVFACISNMPSIIKGIENTYCSSCKPTQCNLCHFYAFMDRYEDN